MGGAEFFKDVDLIVTYNGKSFDVPVMETRWLFHRLQTPLDNVPHFDMVHPARRLWRAPVPHRRTCDDGGCRLGTLERTLVNMNRVGDVRGFEIPARFFRFLRSSDPRPLEPVLEHNRLDLVSLAAVMARAVDWYAADTSHAAIAERRSRSVALYERAGAEIALSGREGVLNRAASCYRRGAESRTADIRAEALYRLALGAGENDGSLKRQPSGEVLDLTEPRRCAPALCGSARSARDPSRAPLARPRQARRSPSETRRVAGARAGIDGSSRIDAPGARWVPATGWRAIVLEVQNEHDAQRCGD